MARDDVREGTLRRESRKNTAKAGRGVAKADAGEGTAPARWARTAMLKPKALANDDFREEAAPARWARTAMLKPMALTNDDAGEGAAPPLLHRPKKLRLNNRVRTLALFVCATLALATLVVVGIYVGAEASGSDFQQKNLAPVPQHLFGTDWMGRDMFLRTVAGMSTSVLVGLFAAGASSVIALVLGLVAALGGRKADAAVSWLIDLMMGLPHIILLILVSFALGKGFWGVAIGVALTHWPGLARIVRAEVLQCRQAAYVTAASRLGQGRLRIALRHMVPQILPQFLVGLILLFPHAILHEAALTFLGFGLSPEQPAIGIILSESMNYLSAGMWWLAVFPGCALIATVLLFDGAGSGLRRLISPRSTQE